jgi:prepilin-type N-terminal cleavage/methylation domain-containing protein
MNRHPAKNIRFHARGITLVEILIVLSVLVVLASFAIPSIGNATARAEMTAATENVRYSLESARKLARSAEARVELRVTDAPGPGGQAVTFGRLEGAAQPAVQDYHLPGDIRLIADANPFVFDTRGLAENPGRLVLVSTVDESITATVTVE